MHSILISEVGLEQVEELQFISRKTFYDSFSHENTEADMQKYLNEDLSLETLRSEILLPDSEFYFATVNQQVVGYLKLNTKQAQTDLIDQNSLEIQRIYVLKEYHGKSVGQALYQKALEIAFAKQVDFVWLGVWENNLRAIKFYEKNGFEVFGKHAFLLGNDLQEDLLMKRKM